MTAKGSQIGGEIARAAASAAEGERKAAEGSQVELFASPVDLSQHPAIANQADKVRKVGRPEGASNLTTKALREYMLARGIVPAFAIMQHFMDGPRALARLMELDGTVEGRGKALAEWVKMGDSLNRYVMAPMQPVDDQGRSVPMMLVQIGSDGRVVATGPGGQQLPPWLAHEPERNQALSETEDPESQEEKSQE